MTTRSLRLSVLVAVGVTLATSTARLAAQDDVVVLLDRSASMLEKVPGKPGAYHDDPKDARKTKEATQAIDSFVSDMLEPGDYFALINFGNGTELFASQAITYTHEKEVLRRRLKSLTFGDTKTDIVAGVKESLALIEQLGHPERRKILVVITDGENDPPPSSPFVTPSQQKQALATMGSKIRANKWNVALVGLGAQTGVSKIAAGLGVDKDRVFSLNDQQKGLIEDRLRAIFLSERTARVELTQPAWKLRLRPGLVGGYRPGEIAIPLVSHYPRPVEVSLNTLQPLAFPGSDGLSAEVEPVSVELQPEETKELRATVRFAGPRPEDGRLAERYQFQFAEGSQPFYPPAGSIELVLPSWWETYGLYVVALLVASGLAVLVLWRLWRRSQVPEIELAVTANGKAIGEPLTLRKGDGFEIANKLEGQSVPAKGLSCTVAASVKYLGNRRFEVVGQEASILNGKKPTAKLIVGLDEPFDLKDATDNLLRGVAFTDPRQLDIFGAHDDSSPF